MKGSSEVDPYPYLDEVCIFQGKPGGGKTIDPRYEWKGGGASSLVVDKSVFDDFAIMGIKPCVYFAWNTDEEVYAKAYENGALGFTCDDPYTCGIILDKIGARPLKNK
jgi:hypothetical protein